MGILPLWDIDLCVAEVERLATLGFRAVAFSENPTKLRLPSIHTRHWDPLFRAVEASDLAICMHIGSSTEVVNSSADAPYPVHVGLIGLNSMIACADWLFSHIFHEFPGLRVSLSEGGAGWAPWLAERCDFAWERHGFHSGISRDRRPSELLREHIWLCMIQDDLALELREKIGVDKIMWECDYPHSDSLWPHSVAALEKSLSGLPADEGKLIAEDNARRLFRFPGGIYR
jgi:predicted TIM-barrel fold metal-dependent hydrolase